MPVCTLVVQLNADGTFQFSYTAADGHAVALGQFGLVLSKLVVTALENPSVQIPTAAERAALAEVAPVEASTAPHPDGPLPG